MSLILDGKKVSQEIAEKLTTRIKDGQLKICLAIIQVGHRPESTVYINQKIKFGEKIGMQVRVFHFDTMISTKGLVEEIHQLNLNPEIQGIIVQLPLPEHIAKEEVINAIDPQKDADGLTAVNLRKLMEGNKGIVPATARGVLTLLEYYQIPIEGKKVTLVGRSVLVGKSTALLLNNRNATVTLCHRHTKNISEEIKRADIVIVAAGQPNLVTAKDVHSEQVIVDVGINAIEIAEDDATIKRKLVGDVAYEEVKEKVKAISPVPGGVGPMTVASLFQNVIDAHGVDKI